MRTSRRERARQRAHQYLGQRFDAARCAVERLPVGTDMIRAAYTRLPHDNRVLRDADRLIDEHNQRARNLAQELDALHHPPSPTQEPPWSPSQPRSRPR